LNFKGIKPFGKLPRNSPTIFLEALFLNIILDGTTCVEEIEVSVHSEFWQDLRIWDKFDFDLEFAREAALRSCENDILFVIPYFWK
jgi:hypothetical protein